MAENTKISWATHSFSPWIGCSKVHPGCQHCYAEAMAGRLGVKWGPNGTRRRTAESTWEQVEWWNRKAGEVLAGDRCPKCGRTENIKNESSGDMPETWNTVMCWDCDTVFAIGDPRLRPRVFPSLCDPFEDWDKPMLGNRGIPLMTGPDGLFEPGQCYYSLGDERPATMSDVRRDFFALIDRCQNLDFLLLTKRPENIRRMMPEREENVWLLYSASDQASLESGSEHLRSCRHLCPVQGFSLEPLLGPVLIPGWCDWIVCGGESGARARPMQVEWMEHIADQCDELGIAFFCKQDSGPKAGLQGRIPDRLWARKEFPKQD